MRIRGRSRIPGSRAHFLFEKLPSLLQNRDLFFASIRFSISLHWETLRPMFPPLLRRFACPLLCLGLVSCGKSKPSAAPEPTPSSPTPAPSPAATPPPRISPVTPEQRAAVLRLRIASGALPAQDTIAALLHRDSLADDSLSHGLNRIAAALLPGWTESQLRSTATLFVIFRTESNESGEPITLAFPATLIRYDASTGLGLLAFSDTFDYADDVGFVTAKNSVPGESLLRTVQSSAQANIPDQTNRRPKLGSPYSVESGAFTPGPPASVFFPPLADQTKADPAYLALGKNGELAGFLQGDANPPVPISLQDLPLSANVLAPTPSEVEFDRWDDRRFRIIFKLPTEAKQVQLLKQELPSTTKEPLANISDSAPYAPISGNLTSLTSANNTFDTSLEEPELEREKQWLLQMAVPLHSGKGAPLVYGKPFLVQAKKTRAGVYPTVSGLPKPPSEATSQAVSEESGKKFPLESRARTVHMVAGGRGALVELAGDPYWKLFWFEKMDWLPLPGDLSSASVTGNLDTLFIYDHKTSEVSRYSLPDLALLSSQKQPEHGNAAIFAGANSSFSPLYFVGKGRWRACDPSTLAERLVPRPQYPVENYFGKENGESGISITGDGQSLAIVGDFGDYHGLPGVTERIFLQGNLLGTGQKDSGIPLEPRLPDRPYHSFSQASENAPIFFRVARPDRDTVPPLPPRIRLFSYFDDTPFAEVLAPEMAGLDSSQGSVIRNRWFFFDPYSTKLATLDPDRKLWTVHDLHIDEKLAQPVLLNWPDTAVPEGKEFIFKPKLAGGNDFSAQITGRKDRVTTDPSSGTLSFPMDDGIALNRLLNIKVPGDQAAEIVYPVLIRSAAPTPPLATLPFRDFSLSNSPGSPSEIEKANSELRPLKAALYSFPDSILTIRGVTAGHAILVTEAGRVDFFSLAGRNVSGSFTCGRNVQIYPGYNSVYEYDLDTRTLTHITVPDGTRRQTLVFPPNVTPLGLGVGTEGKGLLTLVVDITPDPTSTKFSDFVITSTEPHQAVVVLDSETFLGAKLVQPSRFWDLIGKKNPGSFDSNLAFTSGSDGPVLMPGSRSGYILTLPDDILALGNGYGVIYPISRGNNPFSLKNSPKSRAGGSTTGMMTYSDSGRPFENGEGLQDPGSDNTLGPSPNGTYYMYSQFDGEAVEVRTAENGQAILRLGRLAFVRGRSPDLADRKYVFILGDHGPLATLSDSGRSLQLVDIDIPSLTASLLPHKFHVVSQAPPVVMEGQTLQYRIEVNNPAAVLKYELVEAIVGGTVSPMSGAAVSSQGVLTFRAPNQVSEPTLLHFRIGITGKNGDVIHYRFTCYVLPRQRAALRQKPGQL